jgi:hypothetical protein
VRIAIHDVRAGSVPGHVECTVSLLYHGRVHFGTARLRDLGPGFAALGTDLSDWLDGDTVALLYSDACPVARRVIVSEIERQAARAAQEV